jgi:hypothetical protein
MIECDRHGGQVPGFVTCVHVLAGAPIAHYAQPQMTGDPNDDLGEALCAKCAWDETDYEEASPAEQKALLDDFKLICSTCLMQTIGHHGRQ